MKIEVGKYYKTEEGRKAYVAFEIPNAEKGYCSLAGWIEKGERNVGSFWCADGAGSNCALVSEWVEKPEWCKGNPAWARWQAHDKNGEAHWFVENTEALEKRGEWKWDNGGDFGRIPDEHRPTLPDSCRWQDSLIEAPEGWGK